jgi:hypothetical protein
MRTTTWQSTDDESPSSSFFGDSTVPPSEPLAGDPSDSLASFSGFRMPDRSLEIQETKALARALIKKRLKDEEWRALLAERQQLLDKKFAQTITKSELNRLDYVRWSLDQIEDAKYGVALDVLESSISHYESFLNEVQQLNRDLTKNKFSARKR